MADQQASRTNGKKGVTPPKGRPTRSRDEVPSQRRAFGPMAQWIAAAFVVALILLMLIVIFDGGDFNPFNDDTLR